MKDHYTHLHPTQIRQSLKTRRSLRANVEKWWREQGWVTPNFLRQEGAPKACLLRQVATARYEDCIFQLLAEHAGLKPVWLELTRDWFITGSRGKTSLVRRRVATDNAHQIRTRREHLVPNPTALNGKRIREIELPSGEPLTAFHHRAQDAIFPTPVERHDLSGLYEQLGLTNPRDYYPFVLSWFVAHAVLFEDFHGGESGAKLDQFTCTVVEPAWWRIRQQFDMAPLIVKIPWWNELAFYPAEPNWRTHRALAGKGLPLGD